MVFLCLVLKQILHHFIEMVLTSKLFFLSLLECPFFCFVLKQTIGENLSVSLRSVDLNPKKPVIPEIYLDVPEFRV